VRVELSTARIEHVPVIASERDHGPVEPAVRRDQLILRQSTGDAL
jgi:hypothetical protein